MSNQLGELLQKLRGNMTLREVAEKSGLSHTYIRDLELGINRKTKVPIKPSPEILKSLSIVYDYSYIDLMEKAGHLIVSNELSESKEMVFTEETESQRKKRELHELADKMTTHEQLDAAIIVMKSLTKK